MIRYWLTLLCYFLGVDLLGLQSDQQQDLHEFNKLFSAKIENLKLPARDISRPLLHNLVSGKLQYRVSCLGGCQSTRDQDSVFHELDLSIEGHGTLEHALEAYLTPERLDGENQYDCRSCGGRRDAERSTVLVSLPSVLCIHLLRYSYDKKTFAKRKLQCDLVYPDILRLNDDEYRLVAVVYHKGRSANGGHYVCDVLDWSTSEWFHCDDDSVSRTNNPAVHIAAGNPPPPASPPREKGVDTAAVQAMVLLDGDCENSSGVVTDMAMNQESAAGLAVDDQEEEEEWLETAPAGVTRKGNKRKLQNKFSSGDSKNGKKKQFGSSESSVLEVSPCSTVNRKRDAYLLSYVRKRDFEKACSAGAIDYDALLPREVMRSVEAASVDFLRDVSNHRSMCAKVDQQTEDRKLQYSAFVDAVAKSHLVEEDSCCGNRSGAALRSVNHFVPAEWLARWAQGHSSTFPPLLAATISTSSSSSGDALDLPVIILTTRSESMTTCSRLAPFCLASLIPRIKPANSD